MKTNKIHTNLIYHIVPTGWAEVSNFFLHTRSMAKPMALPMKKAN